MSDVNEANASKAKRRPTMRRSVTENGELAVFAPEAPKDAAPVAIFDPRGYPASIQHRLMLQGMSYKLFNSASANDERSVLEQVNEAHAALVAGAWSEPGGSSGRVPLMVEAVMRALGKTREEAETGIARAKEAKIDLTLDPRIEKVLSDLRRERKGIKKGDRGAVDSLFG